MEMFSKLNNTLLNLIAYYYIKKNKNPIK